MKRGEGVDEDGYENTITVFDDSKYDYAEGEQA
jgi:hypothetical protein